MRAQVRARCPQLCQRLDAGASVDDAGWGELMAAARAALREIGGGDGEP